MRMYSVVVPPLDEVERLYQSAGAYPDDGSLDWDPAGTVRIGLCYFGNLTHADAVRLTAKLRTEISQVGSLRLRFTGGGALEDEGDETVWSGLGGDLEALRALAFTMAEAARRDGFLVDRRWYRPRARLATINDATTADALQRIVDRLQAYEGDLWDATEVALIEPHRTADPVASRLFDRFDTLPLAARTSTEADAAADQSSQRRPDSGAAADRRLAGEEHLE